jgi:hypothetical protein
MGADDLDGLLAFARGPAVDRLLRLMNRASDPSTSSARTASCSK